MPIDKIEKMKFSEVKQIFENCLIVLFGTDSISHEDSMFSSILIDYIMNTVRNCSQLGLNNKLMPIANFSLWQGAIEGDDVFYTYRKETLKSDKLKKLEEMMQKTFDEWSDKHLGNTVTVDDSMKSDNIKWDFPDDGGDK